MTVGEAPRFVLPEVVDNPKGWGPSNFPDELLHVPYAPYSKADRLGKIADWTAPADGYQDRRFENNRRRFGAQEAFGSGLSSLFAYTVAADDEATFSVVDRQTTVQKKPGFKSARGGRGGGRGGWQAGGRGGAAGGRRDDRRGPHPAGPKRRYGGYNDKPARVRESSVVAGPEWKLLEDLDFPRMNKLYYEVDEPQDISAHGQLHYIDKSFDRMNAKSEKALQQIDRSFLNSTASDDPVLLGDAKTRSEGVTVYATDNVLATIMCATRSVYSWDIIINKQDNKIFLDKRDGGVFDFVSVNENAADPPMEAPEKENINSPQALSMEATYINRNFSQQVLKENERASLPKPNPFDDNSTSEPLAPVAYRYRRWNLGNDITLVARTQIDALLHTPGAVQQTAATSGPTKLRTEVHPANETLFVNVKALNEFDSKNAGSGAPDWRQKLDSQRGAVMATEIKNNGNKLARWTTESILAGVDQLRLGFVSRATPKDRTRHVILGTNTFKPKDLAAQMNLNVGNGWGILKMFVDLCINTLQDGKYVLVKDPNKAVLHLWSVPEDTFEEDEGGDEDDSEMPEDADQ
ncbi:eukaryotic translation initiation factor 3 subunit D [Fimicolochytrium jonesii]|uniref:eukaryotic translation initiation factor 3 subunit D n=1 Tax=Fimicolochytrium jonesii TaxID=1396493 RepID=UPI0022FE945F|nr:eukaryotic translation initiation factor 3 subunit D [Fimicolochytrium jonesii]KAI8817732.1 eukaryotic translation initiation factor 3 subunit D [Fimicolochytrium jonesii]